MLSWQGKITVAKCLVNVHARQLNINKFMLVTLAAALHGNSTWTKFMLAAWPADLVRKHKGLFKEAFVPPRSLQLLGVT